MASVRRRGPSFTDESEVCLRGVVLRFTAREGAPRKHQMCS
jgi:hypothetical protein